MEPEFKKKKQLPKRRQVQINTEYLISKKSQVIKISNEVLEDTGEEREIGVLSVSFFLSFLIYLVMLHT